MTHEGVQQTNPAYPGQAPAAPHTGAQQGAQAGYGAQPQGAPAAYGGQPQGAPAGYGGQPQGAPAGYGGQPQGGGTGDGGQGTIAQAAQFAQRHIETPETKPFFKTSEFISSLVAALSILIAAAIADNFHADEAWPLVAALSIGYMISRGLAKAGTRREPERSRL